MSFWKKTLPDWCLYWFPMDVDSVKISTAIRANLARLYKARGLSQCQLAQRTGVTQAYISRIINGSIKSAPLEFIDRLTRELGVERHHLDMPLAEDIERLETGVTIAGSALGALIATGDHNTVVQGSQLQQPTALHQLPPPPTNFIGRETELNSLLALARTGNLAISGLRGMGGIGKTAFAITLARQLAPQFPDAQFFLDLRGTSLAPLSPADALAHVLRSFAPIAKLPEDLPALTAHYRSLLQNKRTLLLMDNAADAAQVVPLIPPPGSLLLITSRQHFVLPGMHALDLNTLLPDEASILLLQICPRIAEHAPDLAKACDYLPLALRLAASSLAVRQSLSVETYLARLADAHTRLAVLDQYRTQTAEQIGITASLQLSVDLLDPEHKTLWSQLAVFPSTFEAPAAAAVWAMEVTKKNVEAAAEKLEDLRQYSLIEHADGRWHLHDLARDFARVGLLHPQDVALRHAAHYVDVLAAANMLYLKGNDGIAEGLACFDRERANIEAGQSWAAAHAGDNSQIAGLVSRYPDVGVDVLDLRLHARQRLQWLEAALAAARFLKDHSAEGRHLGNLGIAYAALGETRKAIEFYEQRLVIAPAIGDRRGEGNALGNLGVAYKNLGEPRKAIEFYQQHLTIAREVGDRRGEVNALGNLGLAYANLGEPRKAIELYQQDLTIAREIGDRRGEGAVLGNLGLAYANLGEPRKAIEFQQQALVISREIGDRRGEGNALSNLGNAYANLGEPRKAIEFYHQHLVIAQEIGDRRGEGNASFYMAQAHDQLGQREQAIPLAQHASAIFRQIEDPHAAKVEQTIAQWQAQPPPIPPLISRNRPPFLLLASSARFWPPPSAPPAPRSSKHRCRSAAAAALRITCPLRGSQAVTG
jgi:tetratricopeptide (TPR) repeat protein/transcriptional regulator with XRE-family HTH domain